jgi:hypothetical protein
MGDSGDSPCLLTRCRSRRIITRVIVLLLLGAIANVAIAWCCARTMDAPGADKHLTKEPGILVRMDSVGGHRLFVTWGHGCFGAPPSDTDGVANVVPSWLLKRTTYPHATDQRIWDELTVEYRSAMYDARGWPMLALWGWLDWPGAFATDYNSYPHGLFKMNDQPWLVFDQGRCFPTIPLWPGFAINTVFYAAILSVLWIAPGPIRQFIRMKRHRCAACGYQIAKGVGPVCSECGHPLTKASS